MIWIGGNLIENIFVALFYYNIISWLLKFKCLKDKGNFELYKGIDLSEEKEVRIVICVNKCALINKYWNSNWFK